MGPLIFLPWSVFLSCKWFAASDQSKIIILVKSIAIDIFILFSLSWAPIILV
jgi:hypothetical protein